ncbi:hypothetical protein KCP71_02630 [Salmonella enterica subsp. enterica]|nr:hypothetical protein KCP71_02630 [Salmonella enterica subsp. enterica]
MKRLAGESMVGEVPEGWAGTINEMCNLNPKLKLDDDLDVGYADVVVSNNLFR